VLEIAGVPPRSFVAPGYAYTGALRDHLAERFDWWATLLRVRPLAPLSPALRLGPSSAFKRAASPALVRAAAALSGRLLRLDLHPADFEHPGHVRAGEAVLRRASRRTAVTYDELCERQRGGGPARELARGRPRRHAALRAPPAPLQAPVVLGLALPRGRLDARRSRPRARGLRTLLRAGRAGGFVPHTAFWQASPRWRRAPLYATVHALGDAATASIRRRCWPTRGSARGPAIRPSSPRLRPLAAHALAVPRARSRRRRADHDPAARRVGLDDSPKYDAVYGRLAHWRPGYARLVQRCRRAGTRAHTRRTTSVEDVLVNVAHASRCARSRA
jgi:hypothetical protein